MTDRDDARKSGLAAMVPSVDEAAEPWTEVPVPSASGTNARPAQGSETAFDADLLADLGLPPGGDRDQEIEVAEAFVADDGSDGHASGTALAVTRRPQRRPKMDPERALAAAALARALGPGLARRLAAGDRLVLSVGVPDVSWVEPISDVVRRIARGARIVDRTVAPRAAEVARDEAKVAEHIKDGQTVVGVAGAPARMLPRVLLTTADAHVQVGTPGPEVIATALRRSMRGRVPELPPGTGAGLGFLELVACLRKGETASRAVKRLVAASAARSRATPTDDAPVLGMLEGYGAARDWGIGLAAFLAEWRTGAVAWSTYPTSAVLSGPPGTGKTLFARSLAKSIGARLVTTSVGEWFAGSTGYLDGLLKHVEGIWTDARSTTPTVLFVDELDGLPNRATMSDRGRDYWTPVVNFILTLLDGAATMRDGLILLAATNHLDRVDAALLRPGRFDKVFPVQPPDAAALAKILRAHLGDELPDLDLAGLAETAIGATGAIASGWVRDARARAHDAGRPLAVQDLLAAVHPPDTRPDGERRRVALHEAGHAIVMAVIGRDAVVMVSIVPVGDTAGRTVTRSGIPGSPTRGEIEDVVTGVLGGRAADILLGDGPSAGSGADGDTSDLAVATTLMARVHASFGLGDVVQQRSEPAEIRRALMVDGSLSQLVEADLRRLQQRATDILVEHREAALAIAASLLASGTVTGRQVSIAIAEAGAAKVSRVSTDRGQAYQGATSTHVRSPEEQVDAPPADEGDTVKMARAAGSATEGARR